MYLYIGHIGHKPTHTSFSVVVHSDHWGRQIKSHNENSSSPFQYQVDLVVKVIQFRNIPF